MTGPIAGRGRHVLSQARPRPAGDPVGAPRRRASHVEPGPVPKAIIAPHAGYVYSGPIAASAYARLRPAADIIAGSC